MLFMKKKQQQQQQAPKVPVKAGLKPLPKYQNNKGCCGKFADSIWSIRYKKRETSDNNEMFLRTTIRNFVLYIIFLAAVTIMNFGFVSLLKFYISDGLTKLFLDSTYENGTFRTGFSTHDDVWQYLDTTLPDNLFPRQWYDGNTIAKENMGFILYQNKLLGVPRMTQMRVQDNSCTVPKAVQSFKQICRTQYDGDKIDTKPFGKGLTDINNTDITYSAWFYSSNDLESTNREAIISSYPPNGYVIDLGESYDQLRKIVEDLKAHKWIDLNTRLLTIDFTIYNGNINLFSQIKLLMEFPATGGILTSWSFHTIKLLRFVDAWDYFILTCQIIYGLFIIFYTIEEILDIKYNKAKYFKDIYNLLDLVIITLSFINIPWSIYRDVKVNEALDKILKNQHAFQNFSILASWSDSIDKINAIILFFSMVKIFKFVVINRTLNQLNQTLGKSAGELISFMVVFTIMFISYAGTGYLLFGDLKNDYQSFSKTLFTLFRIVLGDFDFVGLRAVSPIFGPIYFMSYVFFCFFVLMNMFVAIINNSYTKVKEENAQLAPEFMLSDYLKLNYSRIVEKLNLRKNRILDIQTIIESIESPTVTFSIWRTELRKKGYADSEIAAIFSKYDNDGDGVLSAKEKMKLAADIEQAKQSVRQEFRNFKETHKDKQEDSVDELGISTKNNETNHAKDANIKQDRYMTRDDFTYSCERIDRMELLIAGIVAKIDKLFMFLELMEVEKIERRKGVLNNDADQ